MTTSEGAIVEIVEPVRGDSDPPCIKPYRVLVNGADVGLLATDGLTIEAINEKYDGVTTVTLVLFPKRVEIKAAKSYDDVQSSLTVKDD